MVNALFLSSSSSTFFPQINQFLRPITRRSLVFLCSMKIYYAVTASPCLLHGSPSSQLYLVEHIQSLSNSLHSSILKIDSRHYSSYIFFVCSFKTSDLFSILPCHLFHFFICSQIAYLNSLLVVCLSPQQSVLNAQPPHYSHKCFYLHVLMTTLVSYLCTH